jgi:hypothetical protein
MTERNFKKELSHSVYYDMEDGNDTETICYPSLICIITELCDRIEQLEKRNTDLISHLKETNSFYDLEARLNKEVFDWNETGDGV